MVAPSRRFADGKKLVKGLNDISEYILGNETKNRLSMVLTGVLLDKRYTLTTADKDFRHFLISLLLLAP